MFGNRVQVASAIALVSVLALSWPIQLEASPKSPALVDNYQDSSVNQLDALGGRDLCPELDKLIRPTSPLRPSLDYRVDRSRVADYVADGFSNHSWAYAAVAALEGQEYKLGLLGAGRPVIPLSSKHLINCWNGKSSTAATWPFIHVIKFGLAPKSAANTCCMCTSNKGLMKDKLIFKKSVSRSSPCFPRTTDDLLRILAKTGPLMVGLRKEVLKEGEQSRVPFKCVQDPEADYFVLLIGYDKNHLIIKNSRGKKWGNNGIGKIKREKNCNPFSHIVY